MVLFLFIFSGSLACPQGNWERVSVPTVQNLHSVFFTDSLTGWVVGDSGTIIHTADGGNTWSVQESFTENEIVHVFFLNIHTGWASSFNYTIPPFGTLLLKTTNGGINWESTPYPEENIFITVVYYFDSLTGWMGGKPHALVKTTDGGLTWNQAAIDTSILAFFPVLNITFLNQETGYACGGMFDIAGVIWRTYNGGELWYAIDPSQAPADEVHVIHIFDELRAMGAGGDPDYGYGVGMIRTFDGGLNWTYEDIGFQGIAFDLDFRTPAQAWSPLGPQRKLIFSLDTGNTWTAIPTPDSTAIYDIHFPDSLHGWAVGAHGAVLRYIPPLQPSVTPSTGGEIVFHLYPNPSGGITKYELQITRESKVFLGVYDVMGRLVRTLLDQRLGKGSIRGMVDLGKGQSGSNLLPGVYLVRLTVNGHSSTIRLILFQ